MDGLFNLQEIVSDVIVEFGILKTSPNSGDKYWHVPKNKRYDYYTALVTELKKAGAKRIYFDLKIRNEIVEEHCAKGDKFNTKAFKTYRDISHKSLQRVIATIYRNDIDEDEDDELEDTSTSIEVPQSNPVRIHDKSKYRNENEPGVHRELDPEMAELLGLKDKK